MLLDILSIFSLDFVLLLDSYLSSYVRVVDLILGGFLLWGGYKGYKKGFVLEIISLIIFLLGIMTVFYLVTKGFQAAKGYLVESLKPISFVFYIIGFILIGMLISWLGKTLQKFIAYSIFGSLDAFMGMILGVLKYAAILSLLIWLVESVGFNMPQEVAVDSQIYPYLRKFQPWLVEAGRELAPVIGRTFEGIQDLLQNRTSPD